MSGQKLNIDEIFELAENIEVLGGAFYRKAAENAQDEEGKKLLTELAEMEDGHIAIFANLRKKVLGDKAAFDFDPDGEAARYLQTIANSKMLTLAHPAHILKGDESVEEILVHAIEMEKNAILFYLGLMDITPSAWGRDEIKEIIKEEQMHVIQLTDAMEELKAKG